MALLTRRRGESAEQILDREYEELRRPTLTALRSKLGARGLAFDDADLDAFYNQAWHGLYVRLADGEEVDNHGGFLVLAAYRRAIEEVRRLHPDQRAEGVDLAAMGEDPDLAARLDDRRQLRQFMEGMRERLNERERAAVTLCYIHGCTRPEAAELLGVSPQRMEKLMDGASKKVGGLVEDIEAGTWCASRGSLMKAYAFGLLDPDGERWALADEHLRECSGCRAYVRSLRGISAVVPPVGLLAALGALGLAGGGAAVAAGAAAGGAGAGAGAGGAAAGGAGGGLGTAGAAAAARAAVAACGYGVYQVASPDHPKPKPAPVVRTAAPKPAPPAPKAAAAPKPKAAPEAKAAPAPAPAPAATPTTTTTTPTPLPTPTRDGAQEFGFEQQPPGG